MCGEQSFMSLHLLVIIGSPPRVRGTALVKVARLQEHRITPACAGNRSLRKQGKNQRQDHPRVCGEQ